MQISAVATPNREQAERQKNIDLDQILKVKFFWFAILFMIKMIVQLVGVAIIVQNFVNLQSTFIFKLHEA